MSDDIDRVAGVMLGLACGDALGPAGTGGSGAAAMSVAVLRAAAAGEALTHEGAQDEIVRAWLEWDRGAEDVGAQTTAVFRSMRETSAFAARTAAKALHDRTGRTAGAGSLLRTAPVALPFVTDPGQAGLVRAATRISALTHADPDATDACVLWSAAIRHAVRTGQLDVRVGLPLLSADRRAVWSGRILEAEAQRPDSIPASGWVVHAFQSAWCAIVTTPVPGDRPALHLRLAVELAATAGSGVAAIAGGLLGARWGASAIPAAWRRALHGRLGLDADEFARLAVLAANGGLGDGTGWPAIDRIRATGPRILVPHPDDDDLLLGSLRALDDLPAEVDAVVSLCRTGRRQTDREQVGFRLVDAAGRNPNLDVVLRDAADTVAALRAEGKRVLLHCAEGRGPTASVGALYAALHLGVPVATAIEQVAGALPDASAQPFLQDAVQRIAAASTTPATEPASGAARPVLYIDLDTAVLDVASGLARLPPRVRAAYESDPAAAPGAVALMEPLADAIEAFGMLAADYEVFLLAKPPWTDPSSAQQRLEWVQRWFGSGETTDDEANPAWQRLLFAHPRNLDREATLVAGMAAVTEGFRGAVLEIGGDAFPDWTELTEHLLPSAPAGSEPAVPAAPPDPALRPGQLRPLPEPSPDALRDPSPDPLRAARAESDREDRAGTRPSLEDLSRRQARGASRPAADFIGAASRERSESGAA